VNRSETFGGRERRTTCAPEGKGKDSSNGKKRNQKGKINRTVGKQKSKKKQGKHKKEKNRMGMQRREKSTANSSVHQGNSTNRLPLKEATEGTSN